MPTDHDPPRPDPELTDGGNEVDDFARRAGAALRRPAPEDGPAAALRARDRIRTRQRIIAGGGIAVLLIGGIVLFTRDDGSSDGDPVVGPSDTEAPAATTAPSLTTAASPSSTAAPTNSAPTTSAAPATAAPVTASPLDAAMNEWMLDYVGGTAGPASGEPVRIGWVDDGFAGNDAIRAAATYVNTELGGIAGRPVELVECAYAPADPTSCGATLAGDRSPALAIVASFGAARGFADTPWDHDVPVIVSNIELSTQEPSYFPSFSDRWIAGARLADRLLGTDPGNIATMAVDDVAWVAASSVPGREVIGVAIGGTDPDAEGLAQMIVDAGANTSGALLVTNYSGVQGFCAKLEGALDLLGISPIVITTQCPPVDGWYMIGLGFNPSAPDLTDGSAALLAASALYAERKPSDELGGGRYGFDLRPFADLLTAARIINAAGGPDADRTTLRQALHDFTGPAILHGEMDCSLNAIPVALSRSCVKFVDAYQYVDGAFVTLERLDIS